MRTRKAMNNCAPRMYRTHPGIDQPSGRGLKPMIARMAKGVDKPGVRWEEMDHEEKTG